MLSRLTSKNDNRIWSKHGDILLAKDLICLWYDPISDDWEISLNESVFWGKGVKTMVEHLKDLSRESRERKRDAGAKASTRIIVFVNNLGILRPVIEQFFTVEDDSCEKEVYAGCSVIFEILTTEIHFRNFKALLNDIPENFKKIYQGSICEVMAQCIKSFDSPPHKVRYSLAHMTQKEFFKPILKEIRKERGNTNFESTETFENCEAGSRAGLYTLFYEDSNECWKIYQDITSYDKKSAYPSVFVNNSKFPIGRIVQHTGNKLKWLLQCLEKNHWFKIVIKSNYPFGPELATWKTKGKDEYGIEFYDYKSLVYLDYEQHFIRWLAEHDDEWCILVSYDTGYLSDCFRNRIIELYDFKNSILDKNNPQRKKAKTMLDMLYGKGIQRRFYRDVKELNKYFFSHSDIALLPQHSMHVIATVKYELFWLNSYASDGDVIAYDTDGIKLSKKASRKAINDLNGHILKQNEDAGYKTDIGIWEEEYFAKRFVQFKTKTYVYEDDKGLHWKIAGVKQEEINKFLNNMSVINADPIDYIMDKGWTFDVPAEYRYDENTLKYTPTFNKYILVNPNKK